MLAIGVFGSLVMIEVAVVTGQPWMKVNYFEFVLRVGLISLPLVLALLMLRRRNVLRPVDAKLVSWELWLFSFSRWPYVAWGVLVAFKLRLFPVQTTYKVTPKGKQSLTLFPLRLVAPYLLITGLECAAALARSGDVRIHGYVLLSLLEAVTYLLVSGAVIALHVLETRRTAKVRWTSLLPTVRDPLIAFSSVALLFGAAVSSVFSF
jgi:cellulose synthase (UDP-forming)